jgi:8-oxo-dGTP pyrophosphatase MutT (NUDIX family)
MSIKGSYILFFKRNTSSNPNLLEFFIIDCYAGIRLPDPNTKQYKEITNTNTFGHLDPVRAIEDYYSTRTIGPRRIERSNIGTICYGDLNVYVSPHYEKNNINLAGRSDDDFNFTNLPGGGIENCDHIGTTVTITPQLKNACRESSEELGIDKDRLQEFFIKNTRRIDIVYHTITIKRFTKSVFLFIVDLDKIEYENPDQDYLYVQGILNDRITNSGSIPKVAPPHVNEYYRARWVSEVDITRAGKVYSNKFKTEFDSLIHGSKQRNLSIAQGNWVQYQPPVAPVVETREETREESQPPAQPPAKPRTGDQLLALLTESQKLSLIPYINKMIVDKKNIPKRKIYNEIENYLISINKILDEDELITFTEELFKINPLNVNRNNIKWKQKYLKYKQKYLELKKQLNQN